MRLAGYPRRTGALRDAMTRGRPGRSAGRWATIAAALLVAGCSHQVRSPAPPRITGKPDFAIQTSRIVVPIAASLDDVQRAVDASVPKTLWRIDQHLDACVPAKRIGKLAITPKLGCRIVGQVVRGPVTLGGRGDRLTITMPVHATIAARKVGGVLSKTATGDAVVHAVARLSVTGDWRPSAKVSIDYDWTTPPGIPFLGRRIVFARQADARLKLVIARLQRSLPHELARLNLRAKLADAWRRGFTSIALNRDKPPVWMRITPKRLGVGGYHVEGRSLTLLLSADALTETFIGDRPADPIPTPLPPPQRTIGSRGLDVDIPVLADYAQLAPVVKRALLKRAAKGIVLAGIGPVDVRFGDVTIYATTGGRLAVGVQASAKAKTHSRLSASGEIWLTAVPFNAPDAQAVQARDVAIVGNTDSGIANLLVSLFNDISVRASIRDGLAHDFAPDYAKVLASARRAIGEKRAGDFILSADVTKVENGTLAVTGAGLLLPVRASGTASITYRPR